MTCAQSTQRCVYLFPIILLEISEMICLRHDVSRPVDVLSLITCKIAEVCCLNELRRIGGGVALTVEFAE